MMSFMSSERGTAGYRVVTRALRMEARRSPGRPGPDAAADAPPARSPALAFALLLRRRARRLPRLPDLPELRLVLLAAVGPRAAARHHAELRGLPRARPSIRSRSLVRRGCCRCSAAAATASWSSLMLASFVRAGRRALPARPARRFTPLVGAIAAALLLHALRLPVPRRPRLHRHPVPRRSWSGPPRWRPSARAAARRSSCCSRWPALLRPEAWLLAGLYWLWCVVARDLAASASRYAR